MACPVSNGTAAGKGHQNRDARTGYVTEFIPDYEIPTAAESSFLHQTAANIFAGQVGRQRFEKYIRSDHDVGPDNCRMNSLSLEQAYLSHERFDMLGMGILASSCGQAPLIRLVCSDLSHRPDSVIVIAVLVFRWPTAHFGDRLVHRILISRVALSSCGVATRIVGARLDNMVDEDIEDFRFVFHPFGLAEHRHRPVVDRVVKPVRASTRPSSRVMLIRAVCPSSSAFSI